MFLLPVPRAQGTAVSSGPLALVADVGGTNVRSAVVEPGGQPKRVVNLKCRDYPSGRCPVCRQAVDTFCAMMGTVAADLALTLGALGGVSIAGGIVPKFGPLFHRSPFRRRFESKGRFSSYLAAIPTWVITHRNPGLLGLAYLIDHRG